MIWYSVVPALLSLCELFSCRDNSPALLFANLCLIIIYTVRGSSGGEHLQSNRQAEASPLGDRGAPGG